MSESNNLFGVSQYTTWNWTFEEDVNRYPAAGADTIELCEFKLDSVRYDDQLRGLKDSSLAISSVQSTVHTLFPDSLEPTPVNPTERLECMRNAIRHIAPYCNPGVPFVVNTGVAPNGNIRQGYELAMEEFLTLAEFAADHGVSIALEPLNPVLMNTNSFIWTIPEAMTIIDQTYHPALGLCLDYWNVWQSPDVAEHILRWASRATVVHVSDWRLPRAAADRLIVGTGAIPLEELIRATFVGGYTGPLTLELFSDVSLPDSLWRRDGSEVIQQSKLGLSAVASRLT